MMDIPAVWEAAKTGRGGLATIRRSSLFDSQAWAFCRFLWEADGGKYRDALLDYVVKELHGKGGPEALRASLGRGPDGWSALEAEWRAWFRKL